MESPEFHEQYSIFFADRTERLHAMLTHCGHQRTRNHAYRWHGLRRGNREMAIWQYTIAGEGGVDFAGRTCPVRPGEAVLLIVPENHCYYLPESVPEWEFIYVTVHGSELVRLAGEFRRRHGFLRPFAPDSPTLRAAKLILEQCRNRQLENRYQASAAGYNFMMALLSEPETGRRSEQQEFLEKVHAFCLAHLGRHISVNQLAAAVGCSRSHFSRRFEQAAGCPPHEFINELRMRLAVRLLQTTNGSVKEIAASCGFDDTSYFCKVFRKFHGLSPARFRSPTFFSQ